jgi:eukaryotic-like serine/threonine-protein kinase
MSDFSSQLLADRLLAGRYRLVRPVAQGGMAQVWEANDDVLARAVAVKILHPHLAVDPSFLERFRREAVSAARLHSPHIVATYDAGTEQGPVGGADSMVVPFIVMELIRGRTLRQLITEVGPLSPALAVGIARRVAEALGHAHASGVVHRDIKPGNILLCDETFVAGPVRVTGGSPLVKVTDFGIARMTDVAGSDLTNTGTLIGTAAYLSPEQVEGRSVDARSDLYALGVVLHEMLAGRPPFSAETELGTALQHLHGQPPRLRQLRAGVPPGLEAVVLKAMARDPESRYQTAADAATALRAIDLAPDDALPLVERFPTPPNGLPPSLVHRQQGRSRRGPLAVLAAGVLAVGVLVAFLLAGGGTPRRNGPGLPLAGASGSQSGAGPGTAVPLTAAQLLDIAGDDKPAEVGKVIDGNPATMWTSSYYFEPAPFGNLKKGIGIVLTLSQAHRLRQLTVDSPTLGWAADVYVANQPSLTLADWGNPVATRTGINGKTTFDLANHQGGAVLLWITNPGNTNGQANQIAVQEATVSA